ncbi:MAG: MFS transporter [Zavarzinia sp.]|nr:MFS transporter [Zavarzinia sp.]
MSLRTESVARKASAPAESSGVAAPETPYPAPTYAWYVVGVLMLAYTISFIDRQILNLLVGPIKRDLAISDTEMSLLAGMAFALFYTFLGLPIGRLVDKRSRRGIIAIGIVVWSIFTAACGLAGKFWHLFLARIGVGVGEAALSPAAYSLVADYFPPHRMGTAMGVYNMGIFVGSGLAYIFGGLVIGLVSGAEMQTLPIVGEVYAWQVVFFAVGMPGVLVALLLYTVREPLRRGIKAVRQADGSLKAEDVPVREVFGYIRSNAAAVLCHNVGFALLALVGYGVATWLPSFFIRVHGWTPSEIGLAFGVVQLTAGVAGVIGGGWLGDVLKARGHADGRIRVGILAAFAGVPFSIAMPFAGDGNTALALSIGSVIFYTMCFGAAPAAIAEIMPNQMRGQASAVYLFIVNLIGLGLGPTAVALATDFVFQDEAKVGYSLALIAGIALPLSGAILLAGCRPYRRSLERLKAYTA